MNVTSELEPDAYSRSLKEQMGRKMMSFFDNPKKSDWYIQEKYMRGIKRMSVTRYMTDFELEGNAKKDYEGL